MSIRQSIWIRIDRIRHMSTFSADEECNARYENSGRETRIGRYYEKSIIPLRAVLVYAGPVYADPFIANAWRYVGGPLL